jgi:glycosyltransferase involved in cell wall biosynthesis
MRAMLEISRLWQTGFAQGYDESSSYAEFRDTQDADQPLARRISDPAGDRRSEVRGQGMVDKHSTLKPQPPTLRIALLTGGGDKPYALGIAAALTSEGISVDFIGSDDLEVPELLTNPRINFLNLRGNQRPDASSFSKAKRVLNYYKQLISYAAKAQPKLFHLLWNNKFEFFDRTLLMLYYRMLGKKIILTVHNVNIRKRDSNDSYLNRISLRLQYNFCHHIFVHTERMRSELVSDFRIPKGKVSVIPFGINNTVPNTVLSTEEAKQQIGVNRSDKTLLFFGNIAPYKGLEYLISAFSALLAKDPNYRLIIVGRPKGSQDYWKQIQQAIAPGRIRDRIIQRIEYIPDELTALYFKAADLLVLPYTHVFQSGVLFLAYSFGLPAIVADVGTLREEIIEGETGFVFKPRDSVDLARKIEDYFNSELFGDLETRRTQIRKYANERYSWDKVAAITIAIYSNLLSPV